MLDFSTTEGFKHWKDLKRLNHIEGEDGQACAFFYMCISGLVWSGSGLHQYWTGLDGTFIPEQLVHKITTEQYFWVLGASKYQEVPKSTQKYLKCQEVPESTHKYLQIPRST